MISRSNFSSLFDSIHVLQLSWFTPILGSKFGLKGLQKKWICDSLHKRLVRLVSNWSANRYVQCGRGSNFRTPAKTATPPPKELQVMNSRTSSIVWIVVGSSSSYISQAKTASQRVKTFQTFTLWKSTTDDALSLGLKLFDNKGNNMNQLPSICKINSCHHMENICRSYCQI